MPSAKLKSWRQAADPARDAKIVRLWRDRANNGLTKKALGDRFGLTWTQIARIINAAEESAP